MPYVAVIHGATLLFTGASSLVCGSGVVLVPEVLNNIRLASNAFKLCGATKQWCHYMAAPTYTVLKTNIIKKTQTIRHSICPAGATHTAYGVAQEKSHS